MTMQPEHFELIASILNNMFEDGGLCLDDPTDQDAIARRFAEELAHTSTNFNREYFIKSALPDEM